MKDKISIDFVMEQKMCGICKKTSTEYYELKLQVRFTYFNNTQEVKKEITELITKNFDGINKFEEVENGLDIFFRSHGLMSKILHLFNRKYLIEEKRSKKIVGKDFLRSIDVWRYTQLINVINLKRGDKLNIKGKDYQIKAFNKKDLVLINLADYSKEVVTYSIIKDYMQKIEE